MCPSVLVKNTFVCVVDDPEASSPASRAARGYHRARSDSAVSPGYLATNSGDLLSDATSGARAEEDSRTAAWTRALDAGGWQASAAVAEVADSVATLAFEPLGCHVVQRALEVAKPAEAYRLAVGLQGSVVDAARSPHAHFVLEKILYHLGTRDSAFVARELRGWGRAIALNAYGWGVVCRLLEFSAREPAVAALVDEVLAQDTPALCCHKFGHRVAMSIVSNASERQRSRIVGALREAGLQRLARHRFASRVLEHTLMQGSTAEAGALAAELMAQAGAVVALACHSFGVQVVRGLLEIPHESNIARQYLQKAVRKLRKDKYGVLLVNELGLQDPEDSLVRATTVGGA